VSPEATRLEGNWEAAALAGDLQLVDPRSDLERLRLLVSEASAQRCDLRPLFRALAGRDPIALADLAVGPRAATGATVLDAVLVVVEVLEGQVAPGGLYQRLVIQAAERALEVLEVAATRHPGAGWLVPLADKTGEARPGLLHLRAAARHPAFVQACWDHAAAGHGAAVEAIAVEARRSEPVAALVAHRALAAARRAIAALLEAPAPAPLAPWLTAAWGPDPDQLYLGVIPHLRSAAAAEGLAELAGAGTRTHRLLRKVLPGLRR